MFFYVSRREWLFRCLYPLWHDCGLLSFLSLAVVCQSAHLTAPRTEEPLVLGCHDLSFVDQGTTPFPAVPWKVKTHRLHGNSHLLLLHDCVSHESRVRHTAAAIWIEPDKVILCLGDEWMIEDLK